MVKARTGKLDQLSSTEFIEAGVRASLATDRVLFPKGVFSMGSVATRLMRLEETLLARDNKVMGHEMTREDLRLSIARVDEGSVPTREFLFELAPGFMYVHLIQSTHRVGMFNAHGEHGNLHAHVRNALDSVDSCPETALDPAMPMVSVGETRAGAADLVHIFAGMTQAFAAR